MPPPTSKTDKSLDADQYALKLNFGNHLFAGVLFVKAGWGSIAMGRKGKAMVETGGAG